MILLNRHLLVGMSLVGIASCNFPLASRPSLRATTSNLSESPDCAFCHNYPLNDHHHLLHLTYESGKRFLNGLITCADCHNTAVPASPVAVLDSMLEEPITGNHFFTSDSYDPDPERKWKVVRIDTLIQNHPGTINRQSGSPPRIQEWITGIAHMNGTIDVVFDPKNSDSVRFQGEKATYNPIRETCSAVACHGGMFPYRSAATSKGLSFLNGAMPDSI